MPSAYLLFNLSQHPDAKLHFPTQKFIETYDRMMKLTILSESEKLRLTNVYSTVCDTDNKFVLEKSYVESLLQNIAACRKGGLQRIAASTLAKKNVTII